MGKRILVADDSLTIQKAFAMVLGGQDYTVVAARSVDEALVAAKGGRPDLVIADAVLGSGSGYDLCASLKADPALRSVPVHILASSQNPFDEARARRAGADGHLLKPFDSQMLLDSMSVALLAPARPVAEASARPAPIAPWAPAERGDIADAVIAPEDESYGEFTIERGSGPGPAPWSARPPTWPGTRPAPASSPAPGMASRPSLIPGVSPPTPAPGARPAPPLPGVTAASAAASPARTTASRTIMGFPAVGATPQAPAAPAAPAAAARPPVPRPSFPPPAGAPRPAPPVPGAHAPAPPAAAAAPAPIRRSASMPVTTAPAAPSVPVAHAPAPPAAPAPTRRSASMPVVAPPAAPAPLVAAVSSAIDQKVAAIAARGREYEAIAKLSREIIEQVVWEVVPELAEMIIKQELDRLIAAKK